METTRRDLAALIALAFSGAAATAAESDSALPPPAHDMSAMPASWTGKEQIAFLIYPAFTALDMVGPHYMFTNLMGATTHIVAKTMAPVTSDTGLVFTPSKSFDDCPERLDIICVPGGTSGTLAAIRDPATLRFLADRGGKARFVTSVCTGSLLLGAAGLLDGYRATSHWLTRSILPAVGAIPAEGRIVRDRNRITAGGVSAGLDFGLSMVGDLRDRQYAEVVQLLAEYAPEPPFQSGTPALASAATRKLMDDMFTGFLADAKAACETARKT